MIENHANAERKSDEYADNREEYRGLAGGVADELSMVVCIDSVLDEIEEEDVSMNKF